MAHRLHDPGFALVVHFDLNVLQLGFLLEQELKVIHCDGVVDQGIVHLG